MIRTCVVGMGSIGNRHASIYRENKLSELIGVCDINRERADAAAARLEVTAFYDASAMLSTLKPDVCSIATGGFENGSDHCEPTLQALEAGCHVLCEKPISNEIAPAVQMVAKARKLNRCFAVNLNHRFTPAAEIAKRWIDEGRIGHQLFINMSLWIMNPSETSPFYHIKSLHPHSVDVMRYFCGDIKSVHCFAGRAPGRKIWSTAQFNLLFKNGVVGSLTGSYDIERGHPMERCEVAGLKGRFVLDDMFREITLYPAGNQEKTVVTNSIFGGMRDFEDTFRNRINAFLVQISKGVNPSDINGSGADALAAQKVLDAAIRSIETGAVADVE